MVFKTLNDFDASGKKVLARVDVNAPVINGVVQDSPRFEEHAKTIMELAKKGAAVVVLAHQGRAGEEDFTTLEKHAEFLSKYCKKKVKYVDDFFGGKARKEIEKLRGGRILLLENTRFLSEEILEGDGGKLSKTLFVSRLAPLFNAFVNDAFSAAHRSQASLVGFPELLDSYAGRVVQGECEAISKAVESPERPCVYVLGGGKPDDCFKILRNALVKGSADKLLLGGAIGELALMAQGKDLGAKSKWLEEKGFTKCLPELKELVGRYGEKLVLPNDFAFADNEGIRVEVKLEELSGRTELVFDVGSLTANAFSAVIKNAKTVYFKGPVGAFEKPCFELGTRAVLKAVENCKGFTLVGGGHTLNAIEKFSLNKKKFGHVSTAGGALLAMVSDERMPAIEALEKAAERMNK